MSVQTPAARTMPALEIVAANLESLLSARFPALRGRVRVVVAGQADGVEVTLHTLGVPEADSAAARLFLASLTGAVQVPAGVAWFDPRRVVPRRHGEPQEGSAEIIHLADHRRAG